MTRYSRRLYALLAFAPCIWAQNRPGGGIRVQSCTIEAQINPRTQSITATDTVNSTITAIPNVAFSSTAGIIKGRYRAGSRAMSRNATCQATTTPRKP